MKFLICTIKKYQNTDYISQFSGKRISINHLPENDLLPTINMCNALLEANFGENPAKPFKFYINACPGLAN
jgi:hypothetical protein